jgi:Lysine-specific metallo-endopeptidase
MLHTRLDDLNDWDEECVRRAALVPKPAEDEPLPVLMEATRQLFKGWFGTEDATARATIRKRIEKAIKKLKLLHDSNFIPDPTETDYAYVMPDSIEGGKYERTVHTGAAFWAKKTDDLTRAGTVIHELSHFLTVGATKDVGSSRKDRASVDFAGINRSNYGGTYAAYGGERATRLAMRNPALALKNADSFEFFIEGRKPSIIMDELGNPESEGIGDFPTGRGTRG